MGFVQILVISHNLYYDKFGLVKQKNEILITSDERYSKYLLSYKYIPENYDGILIGPSVSGNLNTSNISNYKIYNASVNGGNYSELKLISERVLQSNKIKFLIICLHPYATKNSNLKTNQFNSKFYWLNLVGIEPISYKIKSLFKKQLNNVNTFHSSKDGYNDFNLLNKNVNLQNIINSTKHNPENNEEIFIDPKSLEDLQIIINNAHKNDIKIISYFYPYYFELLENQKKSGSWNVYKNKISQLFSEEDILLDMNEIEFKHINQDIKSYSDGHLSYTGADKVIKEIVKMLP